MEKHGITYEKQINNKGKTLENLRKAQEHKGKHRKNMGKPRKTSENLGKQRVVIPGN